MNFDLQLPFDIDFLDSDDETEDMLASLEVDANASSQEVRKEALDRIFSESAIEGLPPPEVPSPPAPKDPAQEPPPQNPEASKKRFKTLSEEDIRQLEDQTQSKNTKKNTKWGVSIFQGQYLSKLLF